MLVSLNFSDNNLGQLVLPKGWAKEERNTEYQRRKGLFSFEMPPLGYQHSDGRHQQVYPGKPDGVICIADAIKDMRAMTSLNLAGNKLGAAGIRIVTHALKVTTIIFHEPDHLNSDWLNCCRLLLSTGFGGIALARCQQ
jgi:hypothetical protein